MDCVVEAGAADGGVGVAAAHGEAVDLVWDLADGGVEEATGERSVGGKGREEEVHEVGLIGAVGGVVVGGATIVVEGIAGSGRGKEYEEEKA